MKQAAFGVTRKGIRGRLFTLENRNGMQVRISDYGCAVVSILVPDRDGKPADVVLGFDDVSGYEVNAPFFGVIIGRNANRIASSRFELNGSTYQLENNEGKNNLHSSSENGYHKRLFQAEPDGDSRLLLQLDSPDGDQGFPGNCRLTVCYELLEDNALEISYEGVCDRDTIFNVTNHSYFNLGGHDSGSICGQTLQLCSSAYTPVAAGSIPTGEIAPVEGTCMDFRTPKAIGRDIQADFEQLKLTGGYDHNWVIDHPERGLRRFAEAYDEKSGRVLEAFTDRPGVQFYAGNFIGSVTGKGGAVYRDREGFCLETQFFPDSIHHANFPSPVLRAGMTVHSQTVYRFACR